ncbi:CAP domain-containing protein [Faunimonas sp. B44]|uniref:CAP domain-containing protein n=1 Tax=Faunimonas sp. B44 TaxID=3461493 RepID=UPI004043C904
MNRSLHRRACLAFLAGGLAGGVAGCAGPAALLEARQLPADEGAAARLVAAFRAKSGLGPVTSDPLLRTAAERQALAMARADTLSHTVAGRLPGRVEAAGYDWGILVENLGAGYRTIEEAVAGWKASPEHRRNLLRDGVTQFGIGLAHAPASQYRYYWALILAMPRPPRGPGGPFAT